jgi:hypothetical protein
MYVKAVPLPGPTLNGFGFVIIRKGRTLESVRLS